MSEPFHAFAKLFKYKMMLGLDINLILIKYINGISKQFWRVMLFVEREKK